MVKPKQQRKKRPAKKKGQGSRLPKAVEALFSYLGGPGPTAPTIQQTPPQYGFMIDQAPKSFVTSVAEAVVARQAAEKAKRLVGAEPLKKSLVSTFMPQQPQPQTIVVQQSAPAQSSEKQSEEIRKTIMKETSGIEGRLTEQLRLEGANILFKTIREQKGASFGSLPSQEPSYLGRSPSGIASITSSEDVGSVTSAGQFPAITSEALAQYQQQQYGHSIASAKLPAGKVLKGKAPKMTEVAGGGEAAAPKKRGPKPKAQAPVQQPQTFSQSLGGLSAVARAQLPSPSVSSSVVSSSSTGSKSRAREIYQEATSRGLSQSDIVSAMASGGGGAAQQEPQLGKTLGELQKKPKRKFKIVTGMEV